MTDLVDIKEKRQMTSGDRFWLGLWFIVGLTICSITWAIAWGGVSVTRLFAEHGYVEQVQPGSTYGRWIKP